MLNQINTIEQKLDIVLSEYKSKYKRIGLSTVTGIIMIHLEKLVHIEADRSYCMAYLINGKKIVISKSLGDLESRLPSTIFYRVHLSHIVNLNHIDSYEKDNGGQLIMSNTLRIPVSRRNKRKLTELLLNQT